jgi:HK97 gp10 family phage protein
MAKSVITKKWATVTGLKEVTDKVNQLIDQMESEEILKAIMAGAKLIEDEAKRIVPVRTGNLRSAIFASYGKQKNRRKPTVIVGVNYKWKKASTLGYAPYAHIVEFGSAKRAPKPFMGPAIKSQRQAVAQRIKERLEELIEKTVKK